MNSSPKLLKTIFEVQYQAHLNYYRLLMPAAEKVKEYPNWLVESGVIADLRNFDKHCSLRIEHNRCAYDQDSSDIKLEKEQVDDILEKLLPELEVEKLIRVGYRRQYIVPVDISFDSLVTVLNSKLFSQDEGFRSIMPPKCTDLMYRIDSQEGAYKYHFTIGPVHKKELPQRVMYNKTHLDPNTANEEYKKICDNYPDVSLFMDIDIFQVSIPITERISREEAKEIIEFSRKRSQNIAEHLSKYLFEYKIKK